MEIDAEYFKEPIQDEKQDEVFLKDARIFVNTTNRQPDETLYSFRVKFNSANDNSEVTEMYANSATNLSGSTNLAGFTLNGLSYRPYDPTNPTGDIIGHWRRKFSSENCIKVQKSLKNVTKIKNIRFEIPRVTVNTDIVTNPPPSSILLKIDEFSGSSIVSSEENQDICFILNLIDTKANQLVYFSTDELTFDPPKNISNMSLSFSTPTDDINQLDDSRDKVNISFSQINQDGFLELKCVDKIPSSFFTGHVLKFEEDSELTVAGSNLITATVIDGPIEKATIKVRDFDGNLFVVSPETNERGETMLQINSKKILVATTTTGGIDNFSYEPHVYEMRSIVLPMQKKLHISPLSTLLCDYILYESRNNTITKTVIKNYSEKFEEKLGIPLNTNFVTIKNLRALRLGYQITNTIRCLKEICNIFKLSDFNESFFFFSLADEILKNDFNFESSSDIKSLYKRVLKKDISNADVLVEAVSLHNKVEDIAMNVPNMFGKAALVFFIEFIKKQQYKLTFQEIVDRRQKIIPEKDEFEYKNYEQNLLFDLDIKTDSTFVKQIIGYVTEYLSKSFIEVKNKKQITIDTVNTYDHIIGTIENNCIKINKSFKHSNATSTFMFNEVPVHPFFSFLIFSIFKLHGLNVEAINQSAYIDDLKLELNDIGLITSKFLKNFKNKKTYKNVPFIEENTVSTLDTKSIDNFQIIRKVTNVPITDKKNKVSIVSSKASLFNDNKLKITLKFSKATSGMIHVIPTFKFSDKSIETPGIINKKVGKRETEIEINCSKELQQNDIIDFSCKFYYENYVNDFSIIAEKYKFINNVEYIDLNEIHNETTANFNINPNIAMNLNENEQDNLFESFIGVDNIDSSFNQTSIPFVYPTSNAFDSNVRYLRHLSMYGSTDQNILLNNRGFFTYKNGLLIEQISNTNLDNLSIEEYYSAGYNDSLILFSKNKVQLIDSVGYSVTSEYVNTDKNIICGGLANNNIYVLFDDSSLHAIDMGYYALNVINPGFQLGDAEVARFNILGENATSARKMLFPVNSLQEKNQTNFMYLLLDSELQMYDIRNSSINYVGKFVSDTTSVQYSFVDAKFINEDLIVIQSGKKLFVLNKHLETIRKISSIDVITCFDFETDTIIFSDVSKNLYKLKLIKDDLSIDLTTQALIYQVEHIFDKIVKSNTFDVLRATTNSGNIYDYALSDITDYSIIYTDLDLDMNSNDNEILEIDRDTNSIVLNKYYGDNYRNINLNLLRKNKHTSAINKNLQPNLSILLETHVNNKNM